MPVVSFPDHIALLTELLKRHDAIVEQIETRLLNVQGKDTARNRTRDYFDRVFNSCFYDTPGLPRALAELKGQLHASHVADGFEPVVLDAAAHTLDPLELILRAYDIWERVRWPGRNGRLSFARVLFGVFLLRQLELLSLRIWDDGNALAGDRLRDIQQVLDRLNDLLGPSVLVRDARWLIQTAQGPLTRHLAPYFRTADRIAESFSGASGLELHAAGVKLAGNHLRSQLRYRSADLNLPLEHLDVLAVTRNSNAMDTALLVRDLVCLLDAYHAAESASDTRLGLADAILQGISADPELFVTRLDLLEPCTMIETLFVERADDGAVRRSRMGSVHGDVARRYRQLMIEAAPRLRQDVQSFDPARTPHSPLAIASGFCADLLSNMVMATLHRPSPPALSLEDVFVTRVDLENTVHFDYSPDWAGQMFQRTVDALELRAHSADANATEVPGTRMFIVPRGRKVDSIEGLPAGIVPAQQYCLTSNVSQALADGTTAFPRSQILADRNEGRFLASAEIDGKWFAVSKTILTEVIGQGRDALIVDVPKPAIDVLRVACPELTVVVD
ncbi:MAG TPA: hypothetical protein VFT24_11105 [Vicinamibacterales bacterium]|nr:hypothetical protein [Vicinamibacterales bacterium]